MRDCLQGLEGSKDLSVDFAFRKVYDYESGDWIDNGDGTYSQSCFAYHISLGCQHCLRPACTKVCPTGAMHKDSVTGLVTVDTTRCVGCGYCALACPYNVPKVDKSAGHSVKCDGRATRLSEDKRPSRVETCPLRAFEFDDIRDKGTAWHPRSHSSHA
jgi:anaerobic dimethyl sulfoxide reductase subunit B (iron-sulfur subunit)